MDWVDYAEAREGGQAEAASPTPCCGRRAGRHHIWLVWQPGYQTFGVKCESIATDLLNTSTRNGGGGRNYVISHEALFYEPMNLTEFATSGS